MWKCSVRRILRILGSIRAAGLLLPMLFPNVAIGISVEIERERETPLGCKFRRSPPPKASTWASFNMRGVSLRLLCAGLNSAFAPLVRRARLWLGFCTSPADQDLQYPNYRRRDAVGGASHVLQEGWVGKYRIAADRLDSDNCGDVSS